MNTVSNTVEASRSSAQGTALRVDAQKKRVAAMRSSDPDLKYARALLRQMQQNVAIEQMNITFSNYQAGVI